MTPLETQLIHPPAGSRPSTPSQTHTLPGRVCVAASLQLSFRTTYPHQVTVAVETCWCACVACPNLPWASLRLWQSWATLRSVSMPSRDARLSACLCVLSVCPLLYIHATLWLLPCALVSILCVQTVHTTILFYLVKCFPFQFIDLCIILS